jgi:SAM-dependent methyltransferase
MPPWLSTTSPLVANDRSDAGSTSTTTTRVVEEESSIVTTTTAPDLATIKAKQQQTWASGNFAVVASRIVLVSEQLADAANIRAGSRVLDVACGNGNATIAAARSGASAVGVDYVPALLEDGRARATAEGLDVEFQDGDAEQLPFADNSFDTTLSVYGAMFAPDHHKTAAEILRVTRPGGTVGLASWTPDGFVGQMFRIVTSHVPAPAGVQSPVLWGTESHLSELFGSGVTAIDSIESSCVFRFTSGEDFVAFFRRWYGPTLRAFDALDATGQTALAADLASLANEYDRNRDGGSIAIDAHYLQSVLTVG